VEDAHTAHQRSKVEMYGNSVFIVMRTAQMNQEHHIDFGETHFFVGPNFIVTVRHGSSVSYADVRARCENTRSSSERARALRSMAIMDFIMINIFLW